MLFQPTANSISIVASSLSSYIAYSKLVEKKKQYRRILNTLVNNNIIIEEGGLFCLPHITLSERKMKFVLPRDNNHVLIMCLCLLTDHFS